MTRTGKLQSRQAKIKGCLLRQVLTNDLDKVRHDSGGCNSVEEFLLPKQAVVGSNPITRSRVATNHSFLCWKVSTILIAWKPSTQ